MLLVGLACPTMNFKYEYAQRVCDRALQSPPRLQEPIPWILFALQSAIRLG